MIIEKEWFGNDYFGNLIIDNYPNLQSIILKKDSLQKINTLKICNNENLKMIVVENSRTWLGIWKKFFDSAFRYVKNVYIESIQIFSFI